MLLASGRVGAGVVVVEHLDLARVDESRRPELNGVRRHGAADLDGQKGRQALRAACAASAKSDIAREPDRRTSRRRRSRKARTLGLHARARLPHPPPRHRTTRYRKHETAPSYRNLSGMEESKNDAVDAEQIAARVLVLSGDHHRQLVFTLQQRNAGFLTAPTMIPFSFAA